MIEEKTATISTRQLAAAGGPAEAAVQAPVQGEVRRRRMRRAGYTFGAVTCFFSLAAGAVFGNFYWGSKFFRENFGKLVRGIPTGNLLQEWTPERQFPGRTTMNVLVLGIDHDYSDKDQIVKNTWGRSDSILLARVDFANKTVDALTIPRDSAVRIPGYRGIHKINAAHSYAGPQLTEDTIKSVFGVQADAVVSVNFEGFQQIVDAIGGVDLNVTKPLNYDDNWGNLHIHLKPGFQHMNGYQAMGFVRIRKIDSDEMRSRRQHEFLEAVRGKIKSPSTFLSLPTVIDRINDNLNQVNITRDQMFTLMNFARTLPKENIHVETLPSTEGRRFVTIDPKKSEQVIERMFFPNQQVALNISAPNMIENETAPRRHSKKIRHGEPHPTGPLNVETPPSDTGTGDAGHPAADPEDHGTSKGADPSNSRSTG